MVRRLVWLASICALVAGCQSADKSVPAGTATGSAVATAPANSTSARPSTDPVTPNPPASPVAKVPIAQSVAAAPFDPPFPSRTELFEPPRGGQSTVRRDEEHGESVELKGFINVNGPQVILAIDGVLSPIPEGGEKYGVQVISIKPPQVVLQRGRSRWTASLE